jgi:hypothetical protein
MLFHKSNESRRFPTIFFRAGFCAVIVAGILPSAVTAQPPEAPKGAPNKYVEDEAGSEIGKSGVITDASPDKTDVLIDVHSHTVGPSRVSGSAMSPPASLSVSSIFGITTAPLVINWERGSDGQPVWRIEKTSEFSPVQSRLPMAGTLKDIDRLNGQRIIHTGWYPRGDNWDVYLRSQSGVIHLDGSANVGIDQVLRAAQLGNVPLSGSNTIVFNALPYETARIPSLKELSRMEVSLRRSDWIDLNRRIDDAQDPLTGTVFAKVYSRATATKMALLNELRDGDSNVLLIYAHFDGVNLVLPGSMGGEISMDELRALHRTDGLHRPSRDRVVVLASCNAASEDSENQSLASILLKNGIATSVFATDQLYSAQNIPSLLKDLFSNKPIRSAAPNLKQFVGLLDVHPLLLGRDYLSE